MTTRQERDLRKVLDEAILFAEALRILCLDPGSVSNEDLAKILGNQAIIARRLGLLQKNLWRCVRLAQRQARKAK